MKSEDVYAWAFTGHRFDGGTKEGWILANLELAWAEPEYRKVLRALFGRISRPKKPRTA